MPDDQLQQKKQFHRQILKLAQFNALVFSIHAISCLVCICFFLFAILRKDSIRPLYILIANLILPSIFSYILSYKSHKINHMKKRKTYELFLIPMLSQKYHYSRERYESLSMTFLLICFFLFLWQKRMNKLSTVPSFYTIVPTGILAIILLIRVLGTLVLTLYYRRKLYGI